MLDANCFMDETKTIAPLKKLIILFLYDTAERAYNNTIESKAILIL